MIWHDLKGLCWVLWGWVLWSKKQGDYSGGYCPNPSKRWWSFRPLWHQVCMLNRQTWIKFKSGTERAAIWCGSGVWEIKIAAHVLDQCNWMFTFTEAKNREGCVCVCFHLCVKIKFVLDILKSPFRCMSKKLYSSRDGW